MSLTILLLQEDNIEIKDPSGYIDEPILEDIFKNEENPKKEDNSKNYINHDRMLVLLLVKLSFTRL